MTFIRFLASCCIVLAAVELPGPALAQGALPEIPAWSTSLGRDHALTGRIFKVADGREVDRAQLISEASGHPFVLLGEKHDNPDHHKLQAWVIEAMVRSGRRPAIAMEMLTADQAPALARYLANARADAAGLGAAVDWQSQGWPDWSIYAPIAEVALRAGLPIVAADLGRETRRAIGRGDASSGEIRARLLPSDYDAAQADSLARELHDSHCGHLPEAAIKPMMDVQRARDARMAEALVEAASRPDVNGAVLIAGAGHVRRDRAVPWHLARLAPGRSVFTLALQEVDRARSEVTQYVTPGTFDYVWFTPRVDDTDPCARFDEQLRRLRRP